MNETTRLKSVARSVKAHSLIGRYFVNRELNQ